MRLDIGAQKGTPVSLILNENMEKSSVRIREDPNDFEKRGGLEMAIKMGEAFEEIGAN